MAKFDAVHSADILSPVEDKVLTPEEVSAVIEQTENCKAITKDAFKLGLRRLLNLSIEGYPRTFRSTRAIRNEYLRKHNGVQTAAVEDARCIVQRHDMKAALFALVPYVGLPSSMIFYAWTAMRRSCLLAAIYGHDLSSEETRAKILYAYSGIRATAEDVFLLEKATGVMWVAIAGPDLKVISLPVAVAALASVEASEITKTKKFESFMKGRFEVPPEEYEQILDREPTSEDYETLQKEGTLYAMLLDRSQATRAWDIVTDKERKKTDFWLAKVTGQGKADDAKKFFASIDTNGDGTIQEDEFLAAFTKKGMSVDACKKLLADIDKDSDGSINYDEFTEWALKGADSKIAEKHGIYYKDSPIAMGSEAAAKLQRGYAMAKDGVANAANAVSGYATAAAEYYRGVKAVEPSSVLSNHLHAAEDWAFHTEGTLTSEQLWREVSEINHTGESSLRNLTPSERDELLHVVKFDKRLDSMKLSTRLFIAYNTNTVLNHAPVETKSIELPATMSSWDSSNTLENATAGVRLPEKDEQSNHAKKDHRATPEVEFVFLNGFSLYPIDDATSDTLKFEHEQEGILFAQKLFGTVLPKPRYAWNELASDQAQADIAYSGIGQLYLKPSDDSSYEHMVDMRSMDALAVRPAFEKYGAAAYFRNGNLMGIERGGTFFKPDSTKWEHVKFAWRSSLFTWVTVVDHLVVTHLVVSNGINAASREMPPEHPVRRVLHVNIFGASNINTKSNISLGGEGGFLHRMCALQWKKGLCDVIGSSKNFRFETWPQRFEASTLLDDVKMALPLFKHGLAVWDALHKFYERYVDVFYQDDAAIREDGHLVNYWRFRCTPQYTQGLPALSKSTLVDQLTHACFYVTAFHQVAGDVVQYVTTPRGMFFQIREGQDMADAEQLALTLALTASTGRHMPALMDDWSHLLDPNMQVQSAFKALMKDLQQVSEDIKRWNKESRVPYTELDPAFFECSVSI